MVGDPVMDRVEEVEADKAGVTLSTCVNVPAEDGEGGVEAVRIDVSVFDKVVV